jgi:hypothetical protein
MWNSTLLDVRCRLIKTAKISEGSLAQCPVAPRDVLREPRTEGRERARAPRRARGVREEREHPRGVVRRIERDPEGPQLAARDPAREERRLAGSWGRLDPHDGLPAGSVERPEQPLAWDHVCDAGWRRLGGARDRGGIRIARRSCSRASPPLGRIT